MHAGGPLKSHPTLRLSVCGWLVARVWEALRQWVVKEEGQAFTLSNDTELAVACSSSRLGCQVLQGSGTLRTFPDVVMLRTAARRWNVGDRYVALGDTFFWFLMMEQFEISWHCDEQGRRVYTMLRLRNRVMDGIRWFGFHPPQEETLPDEQGMVDMTSFRDALIAFSGNQTVDAQGNRHEITGDVPGYAGDNVSTLSWSLSLDLGVKCGGSKKS